MDVNEQNDWVTAYLAYTAQLPSPEIFRLWSALTAVGAAAERRLWGTTIGKKLYPCLFTLLVGTPGTGKSEAIDPVQELFRKAKLPSGQQWHLSPDNMTKASMVDCLVKAHRSVMHQGVPLVYHYLILIQSELSALMASYDIEFLAVMTKLFDCLSNYDEARRWAKNEQQAVIQNPGMSVLMGVQPGMAATLLPEEAWQVGFTSRLILIYSNEEIKVNPFVERPKQKALEGTLLSGLSRIGGQCGQIVFTQKAREEFETWLHADYAPKPGHPKLIHYSKRRGVHALKLCLISAISRGSYHEVTEFDFYRAKSWMLDAEGEMAKIFPAMNKGTDQDLMESLWYFAMQEFTNNGNKPIPRSQLAEFLGGHVKVERISQLLNHAEDSFRLRRDPGFEQLYFPVLPTDKKPGETYIPRKEKPQTSPEGDWGSPEP